MSKFDQPHSSSDPKPKTESRFKLDEMGMDEVFQSAIEIIRKYLRAKAQKEGLNLNVHQDVVRFKKEYLGPYISPGVMGSEADIKKFLSSDVEISPEDRKDLEILQKHLEYLDAL